VSGFDDEDRRLSRDDLLRLIESFLGGSLEVRDFCSRFETGFNFGVDYSKLSESDLKRFEWLFNEVVLFSEFPDDRAAYPGYRDETAIRSAAQATWDALSG
jgi:hypothetical protein